MKYLHLLIFVLLDQSASQVMINQSIVDVDVDVIIVMWMWAWMWTNGLQLRVKYRSLN